GRGGGRGVAGRVGGGDGLDEGDRWAVRLGVGDGVHLLSGDAMANGVRRGWHRERLVVEGAAGGGRGAVLEGRVGQRGAMVLVVSGRNVDAADHARVVAGANG
ncbi:hypothetical protein B1218_35810, partial [Pseudomonas ogarae]